MKTRSHRSDRPSSKLIYRQIDRPLHLESRLRDGRGPRQCEGVPLLLPQLEWLANRPVWSNGQSFPPRIQPCSSCRRHRPASIASRKSDIPSLTTSVWRVFRRCAQSGRSGAPMRSFDNGTYALRKSRTSRLERRTYSATWLPCRDSVLNSSSRSDRRTRQMRQASDHSSRNRRKADSSQPLGSWKPTARLRTPRTNARRAQTHHGVSRYTTVSARSSRRSRVAW